MLRLRAMRAARGVLYWLALKTKHPTIAGLYFRLAWACIRENRKRMGLSDLSADHSPAE